MKLNTISFLCLILVIFTVAGVNASDVNDTVVASDVNDDVISNAEQIEEISVSDDGNLITDTPKTMTELKDTIDSTQNVTIILNDDYSYSDDDSDLKNGIEISKSITIDGQGHKIDGAGKMRIFQVTDNAAVTFKNMVLLNGWVDDEEFGAAVWNNGTGNVTAINCTFKNNNASYDGGAIYNGSALNCTFINNSATFNGGAIYNGSAVNCSFINNTAQRGGAISISSAVNCSFFNNTAADGGAIYNGSALDCYFVNNTSSKDGGAFYFMDESSLTNCNFTNNHAEEHGGAVSLYSKGEIINCNFNNNTASKEGGAI